MHWWAIVVVALAALVMKFIDKGRNILKSRAQNEASNRGKANCWPLCVLPKADDALNLDVDAAIFDAAFIRISNFF